MSIKTLAVLSKRAVLILFGTILLSACSTSPSDTYTRIRSAINGIRVIDTHEHQTVPEKSDVKNFYLLLSRSYLRWDMRAAGIPRLVSPDLLHEKNMDELWEMYGTALDYCRNTSYYGQFLAGFKRLYNFDQPYFTNDNIKELSESIAKNYDEYESWFRESFQNAGFELMIQEGGMAGLDYSLFGRSYRVDDYITSAWYGAMADEKSTERSGTWRFIRKQGIELKTLDDYLSLFDSLISDIDQNSLLSLKVGLAYRRNLHFSNVSREEAEELFNKAPSISSSGKTALEDFMFHHVIKKSVEYKLPVQIHTGYLSGYDHNLADPHPYGLLNSLQEHPDATFVLFHGGYPWTGEFGTIGKNYANVILDLVWLPQISREKSIAAVDEILDLVPYNKICWGSDCKLIEEAVGSLEYGKDVIATVLSKRVDRGLMTEEVAVDIARKIFRDNAIRVYSLEKKRGMR